MTHTPKDYVVADISLAGWGRKELSIAQTEMPGLMANTGVPPPSPPPARRCSRSRARA